MGLPVIRDDFSIFTIKHVVLVVRRPNVKWESLDYVGLKHDVVSLRYPKLQFAAAAVRSQPDIVGLGLTLLVERKRMNFARCRSTTERGGICDA